MDNSHFFNMSNADTLIFDKNDSPQSSKIQHILRSGVSQSRGPQSSAALTKARKDRRNEYKRSNVHGIDTALEKITTFNSSSINKFNPEYSECEQQFMETLEGFRAEVDKLEEMQIFAVEMVKRFNERVTSSTSALDKEIIELRKWNPPIERLRTMQERIEELKAVMAKSREKLDSLDDQVSLYEEENERERKKVKPPSIICATTIVVALLASIIFYIFKM